MSALFTSPLAFRVEHMLDGISRWWDHATPQDFGVMAIVVIVGVWFLTKYYAD